MIQQPHLDAVTIEAIHNVPAVAKLVAKFFKLPVNYRFWLDFSKRLPTTLSNKEALEDLPPFHFFVYNEAIQPLITITKVEPIRWCRWQDGKPIPDDDPELKAWLAAVAWRDSLPPQQQQYLKLLLAQAVPMG